MSVATAASKGAVRNTLDQIFQGLVQLDQLEFSFDPGVASAAWWRRSFIIESTINVASEYDWQQ